MPVIYKAQQSNLATKEGKRMYHPSVILTGSVNTAQISREIAELSSLTTGDVKNVLDNLVSVIARHLQASESVSLDGFGSFRYTFKSDGKGVETADKVNAAQGTLMVRFKPASTRNTDGSQATRSLVTGAKCVRFDQLESTTEEDSSDSNEGTGGGSELPIG